MRSYTLFKGKTAKGLIEEMKVLVVGSGSCEHLIIEKLNKSELCEKVYCAPGNAGIARSATCVNIPSANVQALADFAEDKQIALTITCSHVPAQHNICDVFASEGLKVFSPSVEAAAFFTKEDKKEAFYKKYSFPRNTGKKTIRSIYIIALCDSHTLVCLPPCKFYEKLYDNGEGPMTSGMGAYSPYHYKDNKLKTKIMSFITDDFAKAIKREGIRYKGLLSFKILIGEDEFFIGDISSHIPGIVIASALPLLENDLLKLVLSATDETLTQNMIKLSSRACACVMIASGGYPHEYKKGFPITMPPPKYNVELLHGGTILKNGTYYTDAGHVLTVRATGPSLEASREAAYDSISKLNFSGMYYRSDIGREYKQ